jgi:hypothetical protein
MLNRALALGVSVFFFGACQEAGLPPVRPAADRPSSLAATSVTRPWKARVNWSVKGVQWAGIPGLAKSLFDGRCSVLSDYVVSGAFEGEATHAGRITGETEHCTQITWSPDGQPLAATYSDGRANMVAADGSRLLMRYGNGARASTPPLARRSATISHYSVRQSVLKQRALDRKAGVSGLCRSSCGRSGADVDGWDDYLQFRADGEMSTR